ncbi:calcium-binding protein [Alkanindiges illinoisensis]|uniref:calcium-binding protein n=1 Tax=Alkanindiges illinoisensis TaxID=197183 RepID=UPI001B806F7C|nr:calcium-binding protein [Alkanindiges illinoisensis]
MYSYIYNTFGSKMLIDDPDQAYWFQQAADINRYLNYVAHPERFLSPVTPTQSAYFIQQINIESLNLAKLNSSNENIANISNHIAKNVYYDIAGLDKNGNVSGKPKGIIPSLESQVSHDIQAAIDFAGLGVSQWGGAFYFWDTKITEDGEVNGAGAKKIGQTIVDAGKVDEFVKMTSIAMARTIDKFHVGGEATSTAMIGAIKTFSYGYSDGLNPVALIPLLLESPLLAAALAPNSDQWVGLKVLFGVYQKSEWIQSQQPAGFAWAERNFEEFVDYLTDFADIAAGTIEDAVSRVLDDTVYGTGSNDTLDGGLLIGLGDDTLFGLGGNDTLKGGIGSDTLHGGKGNDTLYGGYGADTLYGGKDQDILHGDSGDDKLYAGIRKDDTTETSTNYLNGDDGNDHLYGAAGNDYLYGGQDSDVLEGFDGNDFLYAGTKSNDVDDTSANYLYGGKGRDFLYGAAGNDWLFAGSVRNDQTDRDNNFLYGGQGDDKLYGAADIDLLSGDEGNDQLYGGDGNDILKGGTGDSDELYGEAGNDTLIGSGLLKGGDDFDTYQASGTVIINDSDGKGTLSYNGQQLNGKTIKYRNENLTPPPVLDFGPYKLLSHGPLQLISQSATQAVYEVSGNIDFTYGQLTTETLDNGELGIRFRVVVTRDAPPPPKKPPLRIPPIPPRPSDPLILDLDHDGKINTQPISAGVHFDLDGNGFAENTSWVSASDGFVTLDLNNNGKIDNGSELFGTDTKLANGNKAADGFAALAQYDANQDHIINNQDTVFSQLRIWKDTNQDGISQSTELYSFADLSIKSINLNATVENVTDSNKVVHTNLSSYTQTSIVDGVETSTTGLAETLLFEVDTARTVFVDSSNIEENLPFDILALPNLMGYGTVPSLHIAMANDTTGKLQELVEQFAITEPMQQRQLVEKILLYWTGKQDTPDDDANLYSISAPHYEVLKVLWGKETEWAGLVRGGVFIGSLEAAYQNVVKSAYSQLLMQANYSDLLSLVNFKDEKVFQGTLYLAGSTSSSGGSTQVLHNTYEDQLPSGFGGIHDWKLVDEIWHADYSLAADQLATLFVQNPAHGAGQIESFRLTISGLDPYHDVLYREFVEQFAIRAAQVADLPTRTLFMQAIYAGDDTITGTADSDTINSWDGNDSITALNGDDIVDAGNGNDLVKGGNGNDLIKGGAGNDTIFGEAGNDTIQGGSGNDLLDGGSGNDTYLFSRGDGQDVINNIDNDSGNTGKLDKIQFEAGISASEVSVKRVNNHLLLMINNSADQITVNDYFIANSAMTPLRMDQIVFADGTIWTVDDIKIKAQQGTDQADQLYGYATSNTLAGLAGNDQLYGNTGDDVLSGGAGYDELHGNLGNDLLEGGADNDSLYGDDGDDQLDGGAGDDQLNGGYGNDTYSFGRNYGYDVIYSYDSAPDKLDKIQLKAGISIADINLTRNQSDLILTIKNTNDQLVVWSYFDESGPTNYRVDQIVFADGTIWSIADIKQKVQQATDYNDRLYGYSGNDNLAGLAGNDTIIGYGGDDILDGGSGNDYLEGNSGNDTLDGGIGNDTLDGGIGADTYIFGRGFGQDYITGNYYDTDNGSDKVIFKNDINIEDVIVKRQSYNLIITFKNSSDSLTIGSYFYANQFQLGQIVFANGTIWTPTDINSKVLQITNGNDEIHGDESSNTFFGLDGDDYLLGYGGNDVLNGGLGNDRLDGGEGNDELTGGLGNDYLDGGEGNDTYLFGRGNGQDNIYNYDYYNNQTDKITFNSDIAVNDIIARREGSDLKLYVKNTSDYININYFYYGSQYQLEQIVFADGTIWTSQDISLKVQQGTEYNDNLYGDSLDNSIDGLAGDDYLVGNEGNDILDGGTGNDRLYGGSGNDTYIFGRGYGQDSIDAYDSGLNKNDKIIFKDNIAVNDVLARRDGSDLVLYIRNTTDSLKVQSYFYDDGNSNSRQVQQIIFADGTVWALNDIRAKVLEGTAEDDALYGYASDDTISGLAGNDSLYGDQGNDTLDGGDGNDTLDGGTGNNILIGGSGDDRLYTENGDDLLRGGEGNDYLISGDGNNLLEGDTGNDTLVSGIGNDTYIFGRGDGQDVIYNYDNRVNKQDKIVFKAGISATDLAVNRASDNLIIQIKDSSDRIEIANYFLSDGQSGNQIDQLVFNDGTIWTVDDIKPKVQQGSNANDNLYGYAGNDTLHGLDGNDTLIGNAGDDLLYGDAGDDILDGGMGNDLLDGGIGDDVLSAGDGNNNLKGGNGSDRLYSGVGDDVLNGGDGDDHLEAGDGKNRLYGEAGNDALYSGKGNDLLDGGDGDDYLDSGQGNDTLYGKADNDTLNSGEGDDTLDGGIGSDYLSGGSGNDTYIFGRGYGQDVINNYDENLSAVDKISFKADILPTDLIMNREGSDLVIRVRNTEDILRINYYFDNYNPQIYRIDQLVFNDGTIWNQAAIQEHLQPGTEQNDSINGTPLNDELYGFAGNDTVQGADGNDLLYGNEGNDQLNGGVGNDLLDGGIGNDMLDGGVGNDSYIFGRGYGQDVITSYDSQPSKQDKIVFKDDIIASDISVQRVNDDLVIRLVNTPDTLKITGYFIQDGQGGNQVDQLVFSDGSIWTVNDIKSKVQQGSNTDDILYGYAGNDTLHGLDGNDTLIGNAGDDLLYGDAGDDLLDGGDGNNTLTGGDGNDQLYSGLGNDLLDGGDGDDYLSGGEGIDHLIGGNGNDIYIIDNQDTFEETGTDGGYDELNISRNIDLQNTNIEKAVLTGIGNFYAKGDENDNELIGNDGDNLLEGRLGNDILEGGAGNDKLDGGTGADVISGGADDDYYIVDRYDSLLTDSDGIKILVQGDQVAEGYLSPSGYVYGDSGGIDTVEQWDDHRFYRQDSNGNWTDTGSYHLLQNNIENLILKGAAKTAFGNDLDNIIVGNSQNNYSDGLGGNDTYVYAKGGGTDTLSFNDDIEAINTLKIEGYSTNDVFAQKQGNSVYLSFKNSNDHIWLSNHYVADTATTTNKVDQIVFDSGVIWTQADIDALVNRAATNHAPTMNQNVTIPTINTSQGSTFSYTIAENAITDVDTWDSLTFKVTSNTQASNGQYNPIPAWLSFDPVTRTLSGTPPATVSGTLTFYYWGTDMYGQGTGRPFTLKVNPPNRAPVVATAIADQTVTDGKAFSYVIPSGAFTDADGDALTYSATLEDGGALPAWLTFNATTRTLSGTSPDNSAPLNIKITAKDTVNQTASDVFKLTFAVQNLTVNGTTGIDTLYGGSGNDNLTGQAGNDILYGYGGNDTLDGGTGTDTMYGGKGDDTYVVDVNTDVINENVSEGIDTVKSSVTLTLTNANVENLTLTGTTAINGTGNALNNTLIGNSAVNTLTGGAGDDILDGGAGNDVLVGGIGNDTYIYGTGDTITEAANEGTDLVQSSVSYTLANNVENLTLTGTSVITGTGNTLNNIIIGNSANNTLSGAAGDDRLEGNAGNDTLDGGAGNDTLLGGIGDDTYIVDSSSDKITENAAEGTDSVQSSVTYTLSDNIENLTLTSTGLISGTGNSQNNVLTGNSAVNTLTGGAGDDTLNGGAGNDTLIGGIGNDTYVVDSTSDVINENANEGTDTIQSSVTRTIDNNVENLTLTGTTAINGTGNALNNIIIGNSAVNILSAGTGDDTLDGGAGNDKLTGGLGNDIYVVDSTSDTVTENANEGTDTIQSSVTRTLDANVENLTLTGTGANSATGNTLNNILLGNSAINTLTGLAGDDYLDGGAGADKLIGGVGNDTYVIDNTGDVITENANEGTDSVQSSITYTLGTNLENLNLTGSSVINGTGNTLANTLKGNTAANTLTGGTGNDTYLFDRSSGIDTLVENDTTSGNKDTLSFGSDIAADQLWFTKSGNNLEVSVIGTSNKAVMKDWYLGNQYHMEQLKSGNNLTLLDTQVQNLVQAMAGMTPPAAGQTSLPPEYQTQLNAVITANWK